MKTYHYIFRNIQKRIVAFLPLVVLAPFWLPAQGLYITEGAQWVISGAPSLVLNNTDLINNGSFGTGSSTVVFTGDTRRSVIGGRVPISFYNVVVSKPSNDLLLNNNTAITGSIVMDKGNLQLNNYTLDLGSSGSIMGERDSSCITGVDGGLIKIKMLLNAPHSINPGNIGVELTSEADLGVTVITRGHVPPSNSGGQSGIQRYFDIMPEINTDLPATLRFFYLDNELAGKNKSDLVLFSSQEGRSDWSLWGKDKADLAAGWVVKSSAGGLHRFTLSNFSASGRIPVRKGVALELYPNPCYGEFRVLLASDMEKDRILNLYDQRGHLLESRVVHCQAGANNIEWNIRNLAGGIYYLAAEGLSAGSLKIIKY